MEILTDETDGFTITKVKAHPLDNNQKSSDLPYLVLDMISEKIIGSPQGKPARNNMRTSNFDVLIFVRCDNSWESIANAKD